MVVQVSESSRPLTTSESVDDPLGHPPRSSSPRRDFLVATTEPGHQYSRSLYEAMPDATVVPAGPPDGDLVRRLRSVDVLHVAWPEHWLGLDPEVARHTLTSSRRQAS